MKILLLENNKELSKIIKKQLEKENYIVDSFTNTQKALESLKNGYSCFILDIELPNTDGIFLLESIRMNNSNVPIIMIADNDPEKIEKAYKAACTDYVKKPFFIIELILKIKKYCCAQNDFVQFNKDYKFDFKNQILYKKNEEIELTKKEILFLELFSKSLHHVASYEEISEYVWEGEQTNLTNIRAMIKRLRKKIPKESINIVKGLGYSLNKNVKFA